jgi:hypothetical protein
VSQVRGRPFQRGNKFGKGRRAGSRNKATIALQQLLDDSGKAIITKGEVMALQGDPVALRLCWERLLPPCKHSPVQFKLPPISSAADVGRAQETVLEAIASGKLTPADGEAVARVLELRGQSIERVDLAARLRDVEQRLQELPK